MSHPYFRGTDPPTNPDLFSRASKRTTFEEAEEFTGFQFGNRAAGTVSARIYDKTAEVKRKGSLYWHRIWGEDFDPNKRVLRLEFELGRQGLKEFGIDTPDQALDAAGSLWQNLTTHWLTLRMPSADQTKSRWPIAPEWEALQRATLSHDAWGIARIYADSRRGRLENLIPGINGYLSSVGALTGTVALPETLAKVRELLEAYERESGILFPDRVMDKQRKFNLG